MLTDEEVDGFLVSTQDEPPMFTDEQIAEKYERFKEKARKSCRCGGLRCYPIQNTENICPVEWLMWMEAHSQGEGHDGGFCDGWHVIKCLECPDWAYSASPAETGGRENLRENL